MAISFKILILFCIQVVNVTSVSKKKGIVHMVGDWICGDELALDKIEWWYDYSPNRNFFNSRSNCSPFKTSKKYNDSFVIMAWGLSSKLVTINNEKYCMGYNEPNHMTQSDITAEEAAAAWPYLEQKCRGAKLISPSACICGGDMCNDKTTDWFDKFFLYCKNCRVDYIATHTFSCNANKVMRYLEDLYKRYGKTIWLTEFTCAQQDNVEIIKIFLKQILPRLEASPFIDRYAYYKARIMTDHYVKKAASLLKQDVPELNELGKIYNDFDGEPIPLEDDVPDDAEVDDEEGNRLESILGVKKPEAMILAIAFTDYFTKWHEIFYAIELQLGSLPPTIAGIYMSAPKSIIKNRIKLTLQKIICTDPEVIDDKDISAEAERIRNLVKGKKIKQSLRRPEC